MGVLGKKNHMGHEHSQGTVHTPSTRSGSVLLVFTAVFGRDGSAEWVQLQGFVIQQKKFAERLEPGESVKR